MTSLRTAIAPLLALTLAECAGTMPGAVSEAPEQKMALEGRWMFSAPRAPPCGVTFTPANATSGKVAPEGGCPANLFRSRSWALEGDDLVIHDENGESLAQLRFVGGRFEGQSATGTKLSLVRTILPSN